jgi:TonB-dependent starch-binding outer membrane protein SusC
MEFYLVKGKLKYCRMNSRVFMLCIASVFPMLISAQKISIHVKREPIRFVMKEIRRQIGYNFLMEDSVERRIGLITVDFDNLYIKKGMAKILLGKPVFFNIDDECITIRCKIDVNSSKVTVPVLTSSNSRLSGSVTDDNNLPIPKANVKLKGSEKLISTDEKGNFIFDSIPGEGVIIISARDHTQAEYKYDINIKQTYLLHPIQPNTEKFIYNGLYLMPKIYNVGNASAIRRTDIKHLPINNPLSGFHGRVPGLYISQASGLPGHAENINLRGLNSIIGQNKPLIILDGVPIDNVPVSTLNASMNISGLADLRDNDLESVTVLKDADATAIYGARGANGVIIIRTKTPDATYIGRPHVSLQISKTRGKTIGKLALMNTDQYMEMRREAFKNDHQRPEDSDNPDVRNEGWSSSTYTDWQKEFIGGTDQSTNADLNITGGNKFTQYYAGASLSRETLVFPGKNKNDGSYFRFNLRHTSENERFSLTLNSSYSNRTGDNPLKDLTEYIYMAPNVPASYNPIGPVRERYLYNSDKMIVSSNLEYVLRPNLIVKTLLGYHSTDLEGTSIVPLSAQLGGYDKTDMTRTNYYSSTKMQSLIAEPQVTYTIVKGPHYLTGLLGASLQRDQEDMYSVNRTGFANDSVLLSNPEFATVTTDPVKYGKKYSYMAGVFRLGYILSEKYVVNLTARYEASSRFSPDKRWGLFGAAGVAWLWGNESFVRNHVGFITQGKLRGSVGKTGNDQITGLSFLNTYGRTAGAFGSPGLYPQQVNSTLNRWEIVNKKEVAIELEIVDRVFLNASFYHNKASDQLLKTPLPAATGIADIIKNGEATVVNSGMEFEVRSINIQKVDQHKKPVFSWQSSFNLTVPKNKLTAFHELDSSGYANKLAIGQPLNIRYLLKYKGVNPENGKLDFEDINNDGVVNAKDKVPVSIMPKYYGGLGNTISYKNVELDFFIQYVKQTGFDFENLVMPGSYRMEGANQRVEALNRWQKPGDISSYQRFSNNNADMIGDFQRLNESNHRVTDASFIRLKSMQLSWNLPDRLLRLVKVNNARIFIQGQNIATWTNYKGLDPETYRIGTYPSLPPLKTITIGAHVDF